MEFWIFWSSVLHGHFYTVKLVPSTHAQELMDSGDDKDISEGYGKYSDQALSRKFRDLFEPLTCLLFFCMFQFYCKYVAALNLFCESSFLNTISAHISLESFNDA